MPKQVGQYLLKELLGEGSFAEVHLAEHIYLGTSAAIKMLHQRLNGRQQQAFRNEARTIGSLKHPHILSALDAGIEGEQPFLVMEYAPRGTLRDRYPEGSQLPLSDVLAYVTQIADALQYAHQHKIIHRDVKPENIFVGENSQVLLGDFGLATIAHSTASEAMIGKRPGGTAAYMAPEQFRGQPRKASDQYALGIMVYEWLCGKRPFQGRGEHILADHLLMDHGESNGPPSLCEQVPTLPSAVEAVVLHALSPDHHRRFPTVQEFAKALKEAAQRNTVRKATKVSRRAVIASGLAGSVVLAGSILLGSDLLSWVRPASHVSAPHVSPPLGTTLLTISGHTDHVTDIAWSPNGRYLASASYDQSVVVWDAGTGRHIYTYRGHSDQQQMIAWSPDSQYIASIDIPGNMHIWKATTGQLLFGLGGTSSNVLTSVNSVSWSIDGRQIALALSLFHQATLTSEQKVQILQIPSQKVVREISDPSATATPTVLAWSPDGKAIAMNINRNSNLSINILDPATGQTNRSYQLIDPDPVICLAWSRDSQHLAMMNGSGKVVLWNTVTNTSQFLYQAHPTDSQYIPVCSHAVSWAPDNKHIAFWGIDTAVQIWNIVTNRSAYVYQEHKQQVFAVAYSPDGRHIASGGDDLVIRVWQAL